MEALVTGAGRATQRRIVWARNARAVLADPNVILSATATGEDMKRTDTPKLVWISAEMIERRAAKGGILPIVKAGLQRSRE